MSYEPGSTECRHLLDAKTNIERALEAISGLPLTEHIQSQLLSVHSQLEGMHDLKKSNSMYAGI
jgi:hypothetical protein